MAEHDYAVPEVLVDTDWVATHLDDSRVRLVESNEDVRLYEAGHIPGAVMLDWHYHLQSQLIRDVVTRVEFEKLLVSRGITEDMTVVFYGDRSNWYAAYAFWLFTLYGHRDCRILNGGRTKWEADGWDYTREVPHYRLTDYRAKPADFSIRAFRDQVLAQIYSGCPLVDARSPEEYAGEVVHPEGYPHEGAQRAGHIPTARNIPWTETVNADGTFKAASELRALYLAEGIRPDQPVITYSRVGERSAHSWFVLSRLLGYPDVKNYDGSWTEWGSLVRAPIERAPNRIRFTEQ